MELKAHEITTFDEPLEEGEKHSIGDLLMIDRARNYHGEEPQADETLEVLKKVVPVKEKLYRAGDSIFLCKFLGDDEVEWHTANADTPAGLLHNCKLFLEYLKEKGVKKAVTYYDFNSVGRLLEALGLDVTINRVDEGKYRTFRAEVRM
jgi:hypothetical protein